jgi:hypothetical protein
VAAVLSPVLHLGAAAALKLNSREEIKMFIFEQNGKATVCQDGRALARAAGYALDNQIAMVQNGQLIGYGRDMHEMLNSGPTIERLKAEATMTKSMPSKQNDLQAKQFSAIEKSMGELDTRLKSMTAKSHSSTRLPDSALLGRRVLFVAAS